MKRFALNLICFFMTALLLSFPITAFASESYTTADLKRAADSIINWQKSSSGINGDDLFDGDFIKKAGSSAGDWFAISIGRLGYNDDYDAYSSALKDYVVNKYNTTGALDDTKTTEYCRISLALLSLGDDPANIQNNDNTINLIADGIYNKSLNDLGKQGVNAYIWVLITLDSMKYEIPSDAKISRDDIINKILCFQLKDGSFTFDGSTPNVDITAMAVQSLAAYYNGDKEYKVNNEAVTVKTAIDNSLSALSKLQEADGSFTKECGVESMAQAVTALCTMGINPESDSRFIKNGNTLLDAIFKYKADDGGFTNTLDNVSRSNEISSYQVLCALTSYCRFKNSCLPIYNCTDIKNGEVYNIFANSREYKQELDKKVEDINKKIKDKLYPFDNITSDDKETVNNIINEINGTKGIDKSKILGYEQLLECKSKFESEQYGIYILEVIVCFAVAVAVIIIITVKFRKSKRKRRESL